MSDRDAAGDAVLTRACEAAFVAMERAYAPYSGFRVGAALVGDDGSLFAGCNVENAAYPAGICAERGAIAAAVAQGVRAFQFIVVATEAAEPTPPCGMCRQVLVEFAPALRVVSCTRSGVTAHWNLAELCPHPFSPHSLDPAPGLSAPARERPTGAGSHEPYRPLRRGRK
ncbi:MAG: cytidine deaminase [Gemmatimonadaceae bacterium]